MRRRRQVVAESGLRLADLTFMERFALFASWWRPGSQIRPGVRDTRWSSWEEYFAAYDAVRSELLAARPAESTPFAEFARPIFLAGGDPADARDAHDAAHLAHWSAQPHRRTAVRGATRPRSRKATGQDRISQDLAEIVSTDN